MKNGRVQRILRRRNLGREPVFDGGTPIYTRVRRVVDYPRPDSHHTVFRTTAVHLGSTSKLPTNDNDGHVRHWPIKVR